MFRKLIQNPILTNLTFLLVLVVGWVAYFQLPREQDPSINFNWIQVWTVWPGASAADVERSITDPLEKGIARISDIKFVSSSSREGVSSILVRFEELGQDEFDKRVADLRREIQTSMTELPVGIDQPRIAEISSSNAFPTAVVVVSGQADDEELRRAASIAERDLERFHNVDRVDSDGDRDPELQVLFHPEKLVGLGISPVRLAETVTAYFQDLAAGSMKIGDEKWLVRLQGTSSDPAYLAKFPILTAEGEIPLRSVADIVRAREDPEQLVRFDGHPAVMLSVFKKDKANNLVLLDQIKDYIAKRNRFTGETGVRLNLIDDQTVTTRNAIGVMESNALIGLALVLLVTWLLLGLRIAFFTSIGIPFVLAGTFLMLGMTGQTLNVTVLLGIVISLGMLVDDAIVVAESMYVYLKKGVDGVQAAVLALKEVGIPVATAVMTTIAAFLPLILLPGVLGDFMRVVPIVVSVALLISLLEAFWMLPCHIIESAGSMRYRQRGAQLRDRFTARLRNLYTRILIRTLRHPKGTLGLGGGLVFLVALSLMVGLVRVDFFASDFYRLFYVNVEMPPGTSLEKTLSTLDQIDERIRQRVRPGEVRAMVSYAGSQITEKEPLIGDEKGQIFVSLQPGAAGLRTIDEMISDMRDAIASVPGPVHISFLRRKTGPPTSKPINIKVRGDDIGEVRAAAAVLKDILHRTPGTRDVNDDDTQGRMELSVRMNPDAVTRAGLDPGELVRVLRLFVGGEIVASMQHLGEKLDVRVRAKPEALQDVMQFLNNTVGLTDGTEVPLSALLDYGTERTTNNIRHYNLRRAITIEADLDSGVTDTLRANHYVQQEWRGFAKKYPDVELDYSGELDDVQQSIHAMVLLFLFGAGLIYLILGAQFKSYVQPLLVLTTVPMAFIGVVFGLILSGNPLSLFTLYGLIALVGIVANDAIVLISTANRNVDRGMPVLTAAVLAARRRVVPILITTVTTIAGLFSLATGLGGKSLMWGPVATVIVWGLAFATLLSLFVIPSLFRLVRKPHEADLFDIRLPQIVEGRAGILDRIKAGAARLLGGKQDVNAAVYERIRQNKDHRERYNQGCVALADGDVEGAIRVFEKLATDVPEIGVFGYSAVKAHIKWMQKYGWDVGYDARARRYLKRAQSIDPDNPDSEILEKAIQTLYPPSEGDE